MFCLLLVARLLHRWHKQWRKKNRVFTNEIHTVSAELRSNPIPQVSASSFCSPKSIFSELHTRVPWIRAYVYVLDTWNLHGLLRKPISSSYSNVTKYFATYLVVVLTRVIMHPQIHTLDSFSCVKHSNSIDDFLANYRHESSSIRSFLSCLEEPIFTTINHTSRTNTLNQKDTPSISLGLAAAIVSDESAIAPKSCKRPRVSKETPMNVFFMNAQTEKVDDPEEERKLRNREYQRRFRAKKVRLEKQLLSLAVQNISSGSHYSSFA